MKKKNNDVLADILFGETFSSEIKQEFSSEIENENTSIFSGSPISLQMQQNAVSKLARIEEEVTKEVAQKMVWLRNVLDF